MHKDLVEMTSNPPSVAELAMADVPMVGAGVLYCHYSGLTQGVLGNVKGRIDRSERHLVAVEDWNIWFREDGAYSICLFGLVLGKHFILSGLLDIGADIFGTVGHIGKMASWHPRDADFYNCTLNIPGDLSEVLQQPYDEDNVMMVSDRQYRFSESDRYVLRGSDRIPFSHGENSAMFEWCVVRLSISEMKETYSVLFHELLQDWQERSLQGPSRAWLNGHGKFEKAISSRADEHVRTGEVSLNHSGSN